MSIKQRKNRAVRLVFNFQCRRFGREPVSHSGGKVLHLIHDWANRASRNWALIVSVSVLRLKRNERYHISRRRFIPWPPLSIRWCHKLQRLSTAYQQEQSVGKSPSHEVVKNVPIPIWIKKGKLRKCAQYKHDVTSVGLHSSPWPCKLSEHRDEISPRVQALFS